MGARGRVGFPDSAPQNPPLNTAAAVLGVESLSWLPLLSFREEEEDKMLEAMIKRKGKERAGGLRSRGFAADLSQGQRLNHS